jgi:large subunit ribosomal protein L28
MGAYCQVTGKKVMSGQNVSHSNNKTKRKFLPNLHKHRFWVESLQRFVKLRVSTQGIRTIEVNGERHVIERVEVKEDFLIEIYVKPKLEISFITGTDIII